MNWKFIRWIDSFCGRPLIDLFIVFSKIIKIRDKQPSSDQYKKILLIKFWGIGNLVMLLPSAKALKKEYPEAEIDFLTLAENYEPSQVFDFTRVYTINAKKWGKFITTTRKVITRLRKNEYDLIIDFEQFARFSAIICILSKGKTTIGFHTPGQHRHFLYTTTVPCSDTLHMTQSFCNLVERAGVPVPRPIKPVLLTGSRRYIDDIKIFLHNQGLSPATDLLVIMHPATSENFKLRRWPARNFAELADRLIDQWPVKIIFTGLEAEKKIVEQVLSLLKHRQNVLNTTGKLNFFQLVGLIGGSDLVISADTAPIHLAASMSVPVIGLYGPNTPVLYGPWGDAENTYFYKTLKCSPCITNYNAKNNKCIYRKEDYAACMEKISVNEVYNCLAEKYFHRKAGSRLKKLKRI